MISWQSIMSVFNTKGTLLKWLKTLDQSLQDGVLQSVTVNSVSEGVITLSFNFADGSVITTPQIDIPQGAQGPEGPQGVPGVNGTNGESFNPMGEWGTDNEYHPFDYVTYMGSSYLCTETIIDGTDAPPIDTAHWQLVAEKGDPGDPGTGPNIPTPTTADNGKVLGVSNGAYALQEAGGGGGGINLYSHQLAINGSDYYYISTSEAPCNSLSDLQGTNFIFGCKNLENPSPSATKFVISVFSSKLLYINVTGTFQGATGADFAVVDLSSTTILDTVTPL